jgi:hypothetical protein
MQNHYTDLAGLEDDIYGCLEETLDEGFEKMEGIAAYAMAYSLLRRLDNVRAETIYNPLTEDPMTRDYATRAIEKIHPVTERIDSIRAKLDLRKAEKPPEKLASKTALKDLLQDLKLRTCQETPLANFLRARRQEGQSEPG